MVSRLSALAAYATRQLDVLGHDRHALGVDRAQVGVFEEADEVGLARLLQGHDGRALEAQIGLEVLRDLANEALERQLADEQLRRLLVTTDLAQRHCSGPVAVGLLDAAGRRRALPRGLGRQLLARRLASGRLAGGLLRTCHFVYLTRLNMQNEMLDPSRASLYTGIRQMALRERGPSLIGRDLGPRNAQDPIANQHHRK